MFFHISVFVFILGHVTPGVFGIFDSDDLVYNATEAKGLWALANAAYYTFNDSCVGSEFYKPDESIFLHSFNADCDSHNNKCGGFISVSEKINQIFVSFRGTDVITQLTAEISDGLTAPVEFYGIGTTTVYFKDAHDTTWDFVEKVLSSDEYKDYDVVFTGHSLGGAMASLGAARAFVSGLRASNQIKLVTFGQPRTGNKDYANYVNKNVPYTFRVVNINDIVPKIPFCTANVKTFFKKQMDCDSTVDYGYFHHKNEIWYPVTMANITAYRTCNGFPIGEDPSCSQGVVYKITTLLNTNQLLNAHRRYFDTQVLSSDIVCPVISSESTSTKSSIFSKIFQTIKAIIKRIF